jgi:uncharacterized protein YhaN
MFIDLTKTEIERRLLKTEQENEILKEKLETFTRDVMKLKALMQIYTNKLKQLEELSIRTKAEHMCVNPLAP